MFTRLTFFIVLGVPVIELLPLQEQILGLLHLANLLLHTFKVQYSTYIPSPTHLQGVVQYIYTFSFTPSRRSTVHIYLLLHTFKMHYSKYIPSPYTFKSCLGNGVYSCMCLYILDNYICTIYKEFTLNPFTVYENEFLLNAPQSLNLSTVEYIVLLLFLFFFFIA